MNTLLLVAIIISTVSASVKPVDIIGGMNPSFEGFVPGAPVVNPNDGSNAYVDNYPHCGVYESQCVGGLLVSRKFAWTFSGYEESVPSFLQFNATYYSNRYCNSTTALFHLSYTWYVKSITNNWEDWEVTGNNLFIKVLSDDVANTLRCENGVNVKHEIMSVTNLVCVDVGINGIMFNYNNHFNKTRLLHLRFNTDVVINFSPDVIPPFGIFGALQAALNGGQVDPEIQYTRTKDFGCCQEEKSNTPLIVGICVGAVVVVAAVVVVVVVVVVHNRGKKTLPKKPTSA